VAQRILMSLNMFVGLIGTATAVVEVLCALKADDFPPGSELLERAVVRHRPPIAYGRTSAYAAWPAAAPAAAAYSAAPAPVAAGHSRGEAPQGTPPAARPIHAGARPSFGAGRGTAASGASYGARPAGTGGGYPPLGAPRYAPSARHPVQAHVHAMHADVGAEEAYAADMDARGVHWEPHGPVGSFGHDEAHEPWEASVHALAARIGEMEARAAELEARGHHPWVLEGDDDDDFGGGAFFPGANPTALYAAVAHPTTATAASAHAKGSAFTPAAAAVKAGSA